MVDDSRDYYPKGDNSSLKINTIKIDRFCVYGLCIDVIGSAESKYGHDF